MPVPLLPPGDLQQPPSFCQYVPGACDQNFSDITTKDAVFFYPGKPEIIAETIETAIRHLRDAPHNFVVETWRDFGVAGHIIFCEICKALRGAHTAVADVTTLNFNLMFEIGYAIGLGIAVIPIRDTSYTRDDQYFSQLGLLDTLQYVDFRNSDELAGSLAARLGETPLFQYKVPINYEQPLYVVKSPFATEGEIKLLSGIDKSGLKQRVFDQDETPQLSLHEAYRQVSASLGVIAHMIDPERAGARVHNARCAFVGGLAMASGKRTLLLQEGDVRQPIDYRDVVSRYTLPSRVTVPLVPLVKDLVAELQTKRFVPTTLPLNAVEKLDFGDVAAENEIGALEAYFVPTAQYTDVRRGNARLVAGRKGTGKTAIFYGVRDAYASSKDNLVVSLKPETHQFTKLRENVINGLSQGMQEHVLTAFWNYLLLAEIAYAVLESEYALAQRDERQLKLYNKIADIYGYEPAVEEGDFSERLFELIERVAKRRAEISDLTTAQAVTQLIYERDIRELTEALSDYLLRKDGVWILVDNLDKGWPVTGVHYEDVLLLRTLLEAGRKLQRQLDRKSVPVHVVAFVRDDIYSLLLNQTPDKGKDTAITLDWDDDELFKRIVQRRIESSTEVSGTFDELWGIFFDSHVNGEESFDYLLRRTFRRPRDLIKLLRLCVSVTVNRGHDRVREADIIKAEEVYSEEQLREVSFELRDVSSAPGDVLYTFLGEKSVLSADELRLLLLRAGVAEEEITKVREVLLWFSVIGIETSDGRERYAYEYQQSVSRLLQNSRTTLQFVLHPALRSALETKV